MEENNKYTSMMDDPNTEKFCFDNKTEFILYAKHCKEVSRKKNIIWINSGAYHDRYMQGYRLFEDGKYDKALTAYKKALEKNPVGLSARFEICECYLKLGNMLGARTALLEMQEYLVENKTIARFYRRMGFIATEQKDYRLAAACDIYSLQFEKTDYVVNELLYIHSVAGKMEPIRNPEDVIQKAKIPIFSAIK